MTYYVGRRASLGIARETSRGTGVTPSTYWLPTNSLGYDDKAVVKDSEAAFGSIQDSIESYVTKRFAEGDFEADMDDKIIGLILTGVFGAAPSTTGSTNYTHTFTLQNTNQHASLSLLVQDPNAATLFILSMLDKFEITVEPEGIVKYNCSFRSRAGQDWTIQTTSYTSLGNKFLHQHLSFKLAASIATLGAATALNIRSLKFSMEKNLKDFDDLGTATPGDILNQNFNVSGSIELGYTDRTYRNYMLANTYRAVDITFTYGTNNSLQFQLPRVSFRSWEPDRGLDDIAVEKIDFKGHYDATNAANVISTCILKNQVASY